MATKRELAERIVRRLNAGVYPRDARSKYDFRLIYLELASAYKKLIQSKIWQYKAQGDQDVLGEFLTPYENVSVTLDSNRNQYYSELPSDYVSLPYGRGVYQITSMTDPTNELIPVPAGFEFAFNGLEAGYLMGQVGYKIEGRKVFYTSNITSPSRKISSVLIRLVAALEGLGEDTEIPMPGDVEDDLVEYVIQKLDPNYVQKQQDKSNDNVSN